MSSLRDTTDKSFEHDVLTPSKSDLVLVDFWATWCGPCRMLAPSLEALAVELKDRVIFVKLDADANPHTTARYNVRGLPTLLLFKDGVPVDQIVGAQPKGRIAEMLAKHGA